MANNGKLIIPGKNRKPEIHPLVGVPLERQVSCEAFTHFWEIARRGWPLIHRPYARTDVNRNEFGRFMLDNPEFTHLVMLDLDHRHPYNIVEQLLRWADVDSERYQVVGGLNFRRSAPYNPCAFQRGPDGFLHFPIEWQKESIVRVDAIGHGSLMVAREVFERIPPPWWKYEYSEWSDGENELYPSKDVYFCRLLNEHGINIWCDTTVTSPHLTTSQIDETVFRACLRENPPKKVHHAEVRSSMAL